MSNRARAAARRLLDAPADELAAVCSRCDLALLVLFGSALEEDQEPSDVDLAVLPDSPLDPLALLAELYAMTGFEGFDVLDLGRASPVARERGLVGGRLLHEARPGLFANTQIAATMERMDTAEMRRVELELMAR